MSKDKGPREQLLVRLRPDTIAAVRTEALARATAAGTLQPSSSDVVQEALDAFFARRTPAKKRRTTGGAP